MRRKKQKLKINTNRMFKPKFVKAVLNQYSDLKPMIKEVTLKKRPFNANDLLYLSKEIQIYLDNKLKLTFYITPYFLYNRVSKENLYSTNKIKYNYTYYNLYLEKLIDYLSDMFDWFINSIKNEYSIWNTINTKRVINLSKKLINENESLITSRKSIYNKYKQKENINIFKDLGGIVNFKGIQVKKDFKNNMKRAENNPLLSRSDFFDYSLARWTRLKYSGFKGTFTISELKQKLFGDAKLMTDYSFKKLADDLVEPVIYQSQFRPTKYKFYTMKHYKELKKLFGHRIYYEKNKLKIINEEINSLYNLESGRNGNVINRTEEW